MTKWKSPSVQTNMTSLCLTGKYLKQKQFCQQLLISWAESTLQKAPVLITLHAFRPASSGTHSCSPSETAILPDQLIWLGLQDPCLQSRYRTAPTTCHFPRFLKLKGILATLPHSQVTGSLLNVSTLRWIQAVCLGLLTASSWTGSAQVWKNSY